MTETLVTRDQERGVVCPGGDVVASSIPELRALMRGLISEGVREMVIDFSNVQMLDSRGIGLLISAHNSLRAVGGSLSVTGVCQEIDSLLRTMRLHRHFAVTAG